MACNDNGNMCIYFNHNTLNLLLVITSSFFRYLNCTNEERKPTDSMCWSRLR